MTAVFAENLTKVGTAPSVSAATVYREVAHAVARTISYVSDFDAEQLNRVNSPDSDWGYDNDVEVPQNVLDLARDILAEAHSIALFQGKHWRYPKIAPSEQNDLMLSWNSKHYGALVILPPEGSPELVIRRDGVSTLTTVAAASLPFDIVSIL